MRLVPVQCRPVEGFVKLSYDISGQPFRKWRSQESNGAQVDEKRLAKYQRRATIIKALAHPARLLIVDELSTAGERCVCELTDLIGSDMSTVSRHLTVLKSAGLVDDEKRGKMVFYRLRVACISGFFDCIESVVACNAQKQSELA